MSNVKDVYKSHLGYKNEEDIYILELGMEMNEGLFLVQDDNRIRNVPSKINSDTYVVEFFQTMRLMLLSLHKIYWLLVMT